MGVPTSEVGYISGMPRREDHKVHKDMWGHSGEKKPSRRTVFVLILLFRLVKFRNIAIYKKKGVSSNVAHLILN